MLLRCVLAVRIAHLTVTAMAVVTGPITTGGTGHVCTVQQGGRGGGSLHALQYLTVQCAGALDGRDGETIGGGCGTGRRGRGGDHLGHASGARRRLAATSTTAGAGTDQLRSVKAHFVFHLLALLLRHATEFDR